MEIFQAIRKDHEKQKLLMKILVETKGNCTSRRQHYEELKEELNKHEIAERAHFYEPLMEHEKSKEGTRNALFEHHEIEEKIEELDAIDMSSPAWIHKMRELKDLVDEHILEEEKFLFAKADVALGSKEKVELAQDYEEEKTELA